MKNSVGIISIAVSILVLISATGCATNMNRQNKEAFLISFGGDEYDVSRFKIVKPSFEVEYTGSRERQVNGVHSILYEFKTQGDPILYADGKSIGKLIAISLNEPPVKGDRGEEDSQAARVGVLNPSTGEFLGIGRATLSRR